MSPLSRFTKSILIISLSLIAYGYLCRMTGLYFFWDSKTIGYSLLIICAIFYFIDNIKYKKSLGKKTSLDKFIIGFLIICLLLISLVITLISSSDASKAAKALLKNDESLKHEIGNITGFGLITQGAMQSQSIGDTTWGNAVLELTIKGDKKFKDVTVYIEKTRYSKWRIVKMEE